MDPRAGIKMTRQELIEKRREDLKRSYESITSWAVPDKVKNKTMKIMPEVVPKVTQVKYQFFLYESASLNGIISNRLIISAYLGQYLMLLLVSYLRK